MFWGTNWDNAKPRLDFYGKIIFVFKSSETWLDLFLH